MLASNKHFPSFSHRRCCIQEEKGCPTTTTTTAPDFDCVPRCGCVGNFKTGYKDNTCLGPFFKLSKQVLPPENRLKAPQRRQNMKHLPSIMKISGVKLAVCFRVTGNKWKLSVVRCWGSREVQLAAWLVWTKEEFLLLSRGMHLCRDSLSIRLRCFWEQIRGH